MPQRNFDRIGNVIVDYTYYGGEDLYSEGAAEDRLLDYVKNHTALDYEHYIQESRSWSVMYHLSYIRENAALWLPITSSDSVLEIGSGCGAITGALARLAKSVTCVELSKKRSLINAYKNREYDNIKIMVGNFEDVEGGLTEKYDYITLIGVLEYAGSYIQGDRPYNRFLEILAGHLNPGGKIVIAIENRLGMKYFAGCKEDHTGKFFGGIEGYGPESGVRTFSKEKLTKLLEEEGFGDCRYYYPYPDYKLPHTIYSDEHLPGVGDLNTNLRNYDSDRLVLFDEQKAFDAMIEEGRFPEFSNSFIVIASPQSGWQDQMTLPIYAKYGNERIDDYRVCTFINRSPAGEKTVFKRALSTHANAHIGKIVQSFDKLVAQFGDTGLVPVKCELKKGKERGMVFAGVASKAKDSVRFEYVSGKTFEDLLNELEANEQYTKMESLILEFCSRLASCNDITEFRRSPGFDEVFGKREFKKKYIATCPCNYDMIFSNIVLDKEAGEEGPWTVLDYEWVFNFAIPVQFVIYRALYYHFRDRTDDGFSMYLSRKGMDVYSLCGIDIGERMLFNEMEHSFQVYIIGGAASLEVMQVLMPTTSIRIDSLVKAGSYFRNLDTPRIYYSRGTNFSSDKQISVIGTVNDGLVSLHIPFERYINSLRIDPTEYPCLLHVERISFTLNEGNKLSVTDIIVNGYKLSEDTYIYDTNDAQIVIEGIPQNAKSADISYRVSMIEEPFYDEMLAILKHREEMKQEEKRRFSYRLKRKAGIIKEDILPEGFVRANLSGTDLSV
ncbi:MAG: class I SAM-dependent methyltransferase [Lachnospiraceae bacterium]|nr:class I SAM-dependent methyltransferase [Lachnospiraceae bacterium]